MLLCSNTGNEFRSLSISEPFLHIQRFFNTSVIGFPASLSLPIPLGERPGVRGGMLLCSNTGNEFRSLSIPNLFSYFRTLAASPFLLYAQKKGTKEKRARVLHPTGALRFSFPAWLFRRDIPIPRKRTDIPVGPLWAISACNCDARCNTRDYGVAPITSFDAAEYRNRYRIRPVGAPHGRGASIAGEGSLVDGAPGVVRNGGDPKGKSRSVILFGYFLLDKQEKVPRSLCSER